MVIMKQLQFLSTCLICLWSCVVSAQSQKPTMKAIMVHQYGGPEVLKYEEVPRSEPKDNEVLVRMIAAGVNPVDALIRSGKYAKFFGTTLPLIPGYDIAGVVEKTGAKVTRLKVGDPIYAYVMWGGRLCGICGCNGGRGGRKAEVDHLCRSCGRATRGLDRLAGAD